MKTLNLYVDDSGTRHPDRDCAKNVTHDWFALGGVMVLSEDEENVRDRYAAFRERWANELPESVPLHSYPLRHSRGPFSWLNTDHGRRSRFLNELGALIIDAPLICTACVIHRPGHRGRYHGSYAPEERWSLCRTAFSILLERTTKRAASLGRKLRVFVEASDKNTDTMIGGYYASLRQEGLPFDRERMASYAPLDAASFHETLYDLKFKKKTSPLIQLADLCLYPLCNAGYDRRGQDYQALCEHQKTIDTVVLPEERSRLGIKYSCFEGVDCLG